eukprot:CAMPEP_0183407146 /NCGR_PEP_ID=MMETSP0370-20130417/17146_1 /TAXON_ID=268820 /ORGANISM="Peridinium aciculiferum, Strain PAER-2" /LENGTH=113 /DNA_ID=CAMNT_0025589467 /DNA_START=75 /DNA_END=416 /DNA_ORIENTATION=-
MLIISTKEATSPPRLQPHSDFVFDPITDCISKEHLEIHWNQDMPKQGEEDVAHVDPQVCRPGLMADNVARHGTEHARPDKRTNEPHPIINAPKPVHRTHLVHERQHHADQVQR